MKANNIDYISYRTFINCMDYSIKNYNKNLFIQHFSYIFNIDLDDFYISVKNLIILFLNVK